MTEPGPRRAAATKANTKRTAADAQTINSIKAKKASAATMGRSTATMDYTRYKKVDAAARPKKSNFWLSQCHKID
jgi:hypothetical protein